MFKSWPLALSPVLPSRFFFNFWPIGNIEHSILQVKKHWWLVFLHRDHCMNSPVWASIVYTAPLLVFWLTALLPLLFYSSCFLSILTFLFFRLHTFACCFLFLEYPASIHHNPIFTVKACLHSHELVPGLTNQIWLLPLVNFILTFLLEFIWLYLPFRYVCSVLGFLLDCEFFKKWGCGSVTFATSKWYHTMLCS